MARTELEQVQAMLEGFRFAMLTTRDEQGMLQAHPLTVQEREFDGDLWFIVGGDAPLVRHVDVDPAVGVAFSGDSAWLSISGTAAIVDDPARLEELWNPAVDAWFPEGPQDSKATLLKVNASSAQFWDSPGRLATLVSLVTSKVTGEPKGGESGTVQLD
ncbi:pyridoxamine 5'-phosphate oxidase family protein [Agrococcus sp. SGAir0287]|uniref:pyridoxamine 5'-phosphate oxidase family protein n=1 Tax=Agrococcus sp. SGAir0287 TaxID=2070347 RepID=UPI0010CCE8F3|nr:pyridoxamine 5'-phosphate oxidase family protein [Agrococcus sp. SGAir0287]QCR18140.1 pyridoxamine 5'-phosphate oxidase [Agrococcus sp. SGAir0287]